MLIKKMLVLILQILAAFLVIAALIIGIGYLVFFHREIMMLIVTGGSFVIILGAYFFYTRFYFKTRHFKNRYQKRYEKYHGKNSNKLGFFDRFDKRFSADVPVEGEDSVSYVSSAKTRMKIGLVICAIFFVVSLTIMLSR